MPVSNATDRDLAHRWFHTLSDETRLQLLELLREGEQCVCDLTDALGAAQSRLSFHLKTLKEAGLVTDRKEGRWVYYALNSDALEELAEFVSDLKPGPADVVSVPDAATDPFFAVTHQACLMREENAPWLMRT